MNQKEQSSGNPVVVGILAHVDAGKTTLTEAILYKTGVLKKPGRVDHGDAFLDTDPLERRRGITIFSKQALFDLGDWRVSLVDTPGHADFSGEMERALSVLDYAVLVISGSDGVQGHTVTLWKLLSLYEIPTFLFINKMDQPASDRRRLLEELKRDLSDDCIDFTKKDDLFFESVAMTDEKVLNEYMDSGTIKKREIRRLIRERKVFPCYFGSALKLEGVEEFLEGLSAYMDLRTWPEDFGARAYKIARDERGERLTFLKITGGSLAVRSLPDGKSKINQIRVYSGAGYEARQEVPAGTLCAVTGLADSRAGQGYGFEKSAERAQLYPVLHYQLILPEGTDVLKTLRQVRELEEEEPLLHITIHPGTGDIQLQLMGDVQTEIIKTMIQDRYGLDVQFGPGNIVYKETLKAPVTGAGHYEPLRHYAEVHVRMDPLPAGSGMEYRTECSEDVLDRNWQRLILTHFQERDHPGVLTGSPLTDVRLTLVAGKAHQKHTEGGDFRQATYRAIRQGLKAGQSILLEPLYNFRLEIPSGDVGRAMSDIRKMYGTFSGPETSQDGFFAVLTGSAPVCEMNGYQREVLSYTKGLGRLTMSFGGYGPCHNEEEVIERIGYDSEHDLDNPTSSVFCAHGAGFLVPWYDAWDYMHIKREGENGRISPDPDTEAETQGRSPDLQRPVRPRMSDKEDAAFKAIYEREFGTQKQEQDRYSGYRRSTSGKTDQASSPMIKTERLYRNSKSKKEREKKDYLLVDGYNVIYAWEELKDLADANLDAARMKLADILSNYQGFVGCTVILVFDAYKVKGNRGEVLRYHNIYVVYTKEAETADQYIEKTTHEIGRKHNVTVATSDGVEQVIVMGQGAMRMSSRDLHDEIERIEGEIRKLNEAQIRDRNYLFDQADERLAAMLEEIRLGKSIFEL